MLNNNFEELPRDDESIVEGPHDEDVEVLSVLLNTAFGKQGGR